MAIGMLKVKIGKKGKALAHSNYIAREGNYADKDDLEPTEQISYGNMPDWAKDDPSFFWQMADEYERKNGSTYREHIIGLPRELDPEQREELVKEWIKKHIGDNHPYQYAIHNPQAMDGGEQPHVHLMYSERKLDGIERDPNQFFKRYNAKNPEKGGCQKASVTATYTQRKEMLKNLRSDWQNLCNDHLKKAYPDDPEPPQIDMRNWKERGLDSKPINLSMTELNKPEIRQAYKEIIFAKRAVKFAETKADDSLVDCLTETETPYPFRQQPSKYKAPTPFDLPTPFTRPKQKDKAKDSFIAAEDRPATSPPPIPEYRTITSPKDLQMNAHFIGYVIANYAKLDEQNAYRGHYYDPRQMQVMRALYNDIKADLSPYKTLPPDDMARLIANGMGTKFIDKYKDRLLMAESPHIDRERHLRLPPTDSTTPPPTEPIQPITPKLDTTTQTTTAPPPRKFRP